MNQQLAVIGGAKGGGGGGGSAARTPITAPDSIRSQAIFEIVEALGVGEIKGFADGVNPLKCVKLDGTPIMAPDGSMNFQGVTFDYRLGTQDQTYIPGIVDDTIGSPESISVTVTNSTPIIHTVNDPAADAVRVIVTFNGLVTQDPTNGDKSAVTVSLQIEVRPAGGIWTVIDLQGRGTIRDKTESPYQRSFHVNLRAINPVATSYDVRLSRLSPDPASNENSAFKWDSIVNLTYAKLRRPNIAYCRLTFDTRYFSSVPVRSYDLMGWLIQVPTADVYDPVARSYTGADWNGTLVKRWCRNPAWFLYHLLTTAGAGLGGDIAQAYQDKWSIYTIAKRCDELVPDGNGGYEPRYSIDAQFMEQVSAHDMIMQLAGIFDAQALWNGTSVYLTQDAPKLVSSLYLPANVVGGRFTYSGTARQVRYTAAIIQYNDPTDQCRLAPEYVEDFDGIQRYGYRPKTETAIGCISRAEAHRRGKRLLVTGRREIDTVTFSTGLGGINDKPGDIIRVADPLRSGGKRMGGRISTGSTDSVVQLDAPAVLANGVGYRLAIIGNDGKVWDKAITNSAGTHSAITVSPAFSEAPEHELEWIVYDPLAIGKTFRVLGIVENEDSSNGFYTVSATQYDVSKFAEIDDIADLEPIPANPYIVNSVTPPSGLTVQEGVYTALEGLRRYMDISWTASNAPLLRGYHLTYRHNGATLFDQEVTGQSFRIMNPLAGTYEITLSAVTITGKYSSSISITHLLGEMYAVESVSVTGLALKAGGTAFSGRIAEFVWGTNALTVLGFSDTYASGAGGQSPWFRDYQVDVYTSSVIPVLLRTDFVTESAYAYTFEKNIEDGGPRRAVTVKVRARDYYGRYSIPAALTVSNPAPPELLVNNVDVYAGYKSLIINYLRPPDNDWVGVIVFLSTVSGFTPLPGSHIYIGSDVTITLPDLLENTPYFLRLATYDAFGGADDYTLGATEYTKTIVSVSTPDPAAIKASLQTALNDPAATPLVFEADTFAVKLNDTEVAPFIIGTHNGAPAILMDADVVVTGDLSADQIKSGRLSATEVVTIGNGNAVINGDGSFIVYDGDDTIANRDFAILTGGGLSFQRYRGGAYINYKSVQRVERDVAESGTTVILPGYWDSQPRLWVSPNGLGSYDAANSSSSQAWQIRADNLVETSPGSKRWKFDAVAELTYASSSGNNVVASNSGAVNGPVWYSSQSTLPNNTVSATVSVQFSSVRGNGVSTYGYLYRTVEWRVQGWDGLVWTDLTVKSRSLSAAEHGQSITDSVATNIPAGTTIIRVYFYAYDTNGSSYSLGGDVYDYAQNTVASNGASVEARIAGDGTYINPVTLTGAAYSPPSGWSIYAINYSVQWSHGNTALAGGSLVSSGVAYGNNGVNYVVDTLDSTTVTAGSASTGDVSTAAYVSTWWHARVDILAATGGFVGRMIINNPTAIIKLRQLQVNSSISANNFTFQGYAWNIAGSTAIATGSLNYIAIGD
jgi:hypothetical protein